MTILDLDRFSTAHVSDDPYRYFWGAGLLRPEAIEAVSKDYPDLKHEGYLTLGDIQPQGAFAEFLDELQGQPLSERVSQALGFDLTKNPRLLTIMRWSPKRAGRIHTDGPSKLATMLVYFNPTWTAGSAGAIRVLKSDRSFDDTVLEVEPMMGNFFGFRRSDHSWHGHLPYEGERRVVQITWLDSEEAVDRKKKRNAFAQVLKGLWPRH